MEPEQLRVRSLGECRFPSPLGLDKTSLGPRQFLSDTARVRFHIEFDENDGGGDGRDVAFEKAGPREKIFFYPPHTTAAVVTCGGLCPGLNNVIRSVYRALTRNYGVQEVLGIRNGYLGLNPEKGPQPISLSHEVVEDIHDIGGTILGSSRGPQDTKVMVEFMARSGIDMLFCLGGDGTQRGAHAIAEEAERLGVQLSVIGIPKTIDNDICFVNQSFGFSTALEKAAAVIKAAHAEARGAINGIGLVKLMGRDAGFIAAGATLVSQEVNFTLIPEVPFPLEGSRGLLDVLEKRLKKRHHAVIVVAEGAGQHLFQEHEQRRDASGNVLHEDIGRYLEQRIKQHLSERGAPFALKYLDPSYFIRGVPANSRDCILTDHMARHAVHAAMCGKTDLIIGHEHNQFIHVPISTAVAKKKELNIDGETWATVLRATGQPAWRAE